MKVTLKHGWSKAYPTLTVGNVYRVLGIEADDLRILNDAGEPILYNPRAFEVVDSEQPSSWVTERGEDGELYAYPPELRDPRFFFEEFFDYNMRVRQKLHYYLHQLCHEESAAIADPPNSYIRVEWKHGSSDDPITLYCELDEERWQVRKVEVFRNGRVTHAGPHSERGTTKFGDQPAPPLEEMAANPEFDVAEISRAEFEAMWNKALDSDAP